jgi:hypothetical protein
MTREDSPGVSFAPAEEHHGLRVLDPVDNHQYRFRTPAAVEPTPASTDRFAYPVDAAVTVRTDAFELPSAVAVYVRNESGEQVASAEFLDEASLDHGTYTLELLTQVKCYLKVASPLRVQVDFGQTRIEFDGEAEVVVGGRSRRSRPAATVTTTGDPEDLMAAVSTFGTAMGTTMPERSYPSLRGHPPAVELGEELDTCGLAPVAADVRLEVPREVGAVLTAAPLAYYLGAPVEPSATDARLVVGDAVHPLSSSGTRGLEAGVERTLKTVFFMDCLTRYDGAYGHGRRLHERELLTGQLGLDFEALYHADHAERVERYLSVPFAAIEPHLPEWKVAAHMTPEPESVETLPFLVDDFALVRTPATERESGTESDRSRTASAQSEAVAAFLPGDGADEAALTRGPGRPTGSPSARWPATGGGGSTDPAPGSTSATTLARSTTSPTPGTDTGSHSFVSPEPVDALEQVWVGEGIPFGASEAVLSAYHNRLDREPDDGEIDITVVCNEAAMDEETDVAEVYGQRENLPFDVRLRTDLTTDELRELLADDHEFLHYIGHAEPDGLQCHDGLLDCRTLDGTGVDAFFLNACRSYEQARALVETGAIVGVGSHTDVTNAGAVELGRTMARLLESGFPFRSALELARENHPIGEQYVVIGDGGLSVVQANSGTSVLCELDRTGADGFELTLKGFPTATLGLGTEFMPLLQQAENTYYLSSGEIDTFELSASELAECFSLEPLPVRTDDGLIWSDALELDEF